MAIGLFLGPAVLIAACGLLPVTVFGRAQFVLVRVECIVLLASGRGGRFTFGRFTVGWLSFLLCCYLLWPLLLGWFCLSLRLLWWLPLRLQFGLWPLLLLCTRGCVWLLLLCLNCRNALLVEKVVWMGRLASLALNITMFRLFCVMLVTRVILVKIGVPWIVRGISWVTILVGSVVLPLAVCSTCSIFRLLSVFRNVVLFGKALCMCRLLCPFVSMAVLATFRLVSVRGSVVVGVGSVVGDLGVAMIGVAGRVVGVFGVVARVVSGVVTRDVVMVTVVEA